MSANDPTFTAERHAVDSVRIILGVGGLIAVALGLFVLFAPNSSGKIALVATAMLLSIYALITGLVYLGTAIFSRTLGGWARTGRVLLGLLYVIGGVIMISNLLMTGVVVAVFVSIIIGVLWLFEGILALSMLRKSDNKVWMVIYAVISIIAGLVLMFSPLMGAATLWLLLGISMIVLGVVQVVRAFSVKAA